MRILILSPLLSTSSFITTYPYAKILSKKHEVKVVGPLFGKKRPYIDDKNLEFEFIEPIINSPIQLGMLSLFPKNYFRLLKNDFDVVHAFKLLPHTAPAAAYAKYQNKKPLILTIDDYDAASPKNSIKKLILKWAENSYKKADAITVSSSFLQSVYGGEIIHQVPNEELFTKKKLRGKEIRETYNLEDKIVILHAGTFYDHKGIDVLIKAIRSLNRDDIKLILIGNGNVEKYKKVAGDETIFTGYLPLERIPDYVDACDIYAIPTKDTIYSRAEISAKIFEAMMLGKAIIASKISDNSEILDDGNCGLLVKPGSIEELSKAIEKLANDKELRNKIGKNAITRYFKNYGWEKIEEKIEKVYSSLGV